MGGLSLDQLRWIFSNYPIGELVHSGWDRASVPFANEDVSTHLWSELHENCTDTEILVAGPPRGTSAYNFFNQYVLPGKGEEPREYFISPDLDILNDFMHENGAAIAFFKMIDLLTQEYAHEADSLTPVPMLNKHGSFVEPNAGNFASGTYPLLRNIYLALNKDPRSVELARPFLEFGFSAEGTGVLRDQGYWPLQEWEKLVMYTRMQSQFGLPLKGIVEHCGRTNGEISIAGSTAVAPVSHTWASMFKVGCPGSVNLESGGTSAGAARLCGDLEQGKPVDIGNMSREWKDSEAQGRKLEFIHDCLQGDERRSAIEVDVALGGVAIVLPLNGVGHGCIDTLGGLSKDQLRWIFSSYNEAQLEETGWDPTSLKNSDGNLDTHMWSELDARCEHRPIYLAGGAPGEGTISSLLQYILEDEENGEAIAQGRSEAYFAGSGHEILLEILKKDGIGFVGYHYYYEKQELFWTAPIEGTDGSFISPSEETIGDHTYPLVRTLHMNLHNHEDSLRDTAPMMEFGFKHPELLSASGYVPLSEARREEMLQRIHRGPYVHDDSEYEDDDGFEWLSTPVFVVAGIVFLVLCGIAFYVLARCFYSSKKV